MSTTIKKTGPIPLKAILVALTTVAASVALSACGGTTSATSAPAASTTRTAGAGQNGGQGAQRTGRMHGTSGLIADLQGTTMQVQGGGQQTAVTFTSATPVTRTVAGTASSLVVGSCVVVRDTPAGWVGGASSFPTPVTAVTATAVAVSQPVDGACTAGGLGAGGGFGGGQTGAGRGGDGTPAQGSTATGAPGGGSGQAPTGPTGGRAGFGGGFGVVGTVTAVIGAVVTVHREQRVRGSASTSTTPSATSTSSATAPSSTTAPSPPAAPTADVTVTTTAATTWTVTEKGSVSDVVVGECVTATGKADDTGTVAATALALRAATNGACTTGRRQGGTGTATTNG